MAENLSTSMFNNGDPIPEAKTEEEWDNLTGSLGGKEAATLKLKSKTGWTEGAEGTNESGYNGLPAGKITPDGYAEDYTYFGFWWSNTSDEEFLKNRNLDSEKYPFDTASSFRQAGLSVRCVED